MKKIIIVLALIFALLWGLLIAYTVHFKLNYFGATFITPRTILSNWIGNPIFAVLVALLIMFSKKD